MNTSPTVLILGARGRFGVAAARAFSQAGWRVLGQVRPGATRLPDVPGVLWLPLDPHDTAGLRTVAAGAAVVVNALSPRYTHRAWRRELMRLTQASIDIACALGATLMLPGSVYNFGAGMPALLREDTLQQPTTFKGRMRVAAERLVEDATRGGGLKAVVIRGGDFFGSGRGSWLDSVIARTLARGTLTYPGDMDVPTAWAYLPDMARAFVRVAQRRDRLPAFGTFHFAGYTLTGNDWLRVLGAATGRPLQAKPLSWPLLRVLGLVMPTLASLCEMRYLWRTPHSLVDTRMQALVGTASTTPFDVAVREALDELGMTAAAVPATAAAWR